METLSSNFKMTLRDQHKEILDVALKETSNQLTVYRGPDEGKPLPYRFFQDRRNEAALVRKLQFYNQHLKTLLTKTQYLEVRGVSKLHKEKEALEDARNLPLLEEEVASTEELIEIWQKDHLRRRDMLHLRKAAPFKRACSAH
jgi:hypothetical protein